MQELWRVVCDPCWWSDGRAMAWAVAIHASGLKCPLLCWPAVQLSHLSEPPFLHLPEKCPCWLWNAVEGARLRLSAADTHGAVLNGRLPRPTPPRWGAAWPSPASEPGCRRSSPSTEARGSERGGEVRVRLSACPVSVPLSGDTL